MAVRWGARFILADPTRVYALLARDNDAPILSDGGALLADDSLDHLARRFDAAHVLRVHRSAIIELNLVRELIQEGDRRYVAILADPAATRFPISRHHLPSLEDAVGVR